jgi:hypothetical protein
MAKGKRSGPGHKARSTRYSTESRWKKNRATKLARAKKLNPGNAEQINTALANMVYRRAIPATRPWTARLRKLAGLLKEFQGRASPGILSSNPTVYMSALSERRERNLAVPLGRVDFSLAARVMGR